MFIIEKPGEFISGVFAEKKDAEAYFKLIPKTEKQKLRPLKDIQHYPFFIAQKGKGTFTFFQYRKDIKTKIDILYPITKDWQPPTPGIDYMGAMDHEHKKRA